LLFLFHIINTAVAGFGEHWWWCCQRTKQGW